MLCSGVISPSAVSLLAAVYGTDADGQEYQSGYGQFTSDVARSDEFRDGGRQQQKRGNEPKYDRRFGVPSWPLSLRFHHVIL